MEQLLIVEDDIGLNQGLCKALKAAAPSPFLGLGRK